MAPLSIRRSVRTAAGLLSALSLPLYAVAADKSAADYYVHKLPGQPAGDRTKMHAGHIEIEPEHNGNLFFWHFQNQHIADRQRTIIWLNGGPGCSSEDGAMMEIGPYRLKDENTLEYNNGSWHEFANLLFVDNPVGTGFSYVDTNSYVRGLEQMTTQFISFLDKFYELFPEYEHDDIYFAGESFAGQYIPYIARGILARNKQPQAKTPWNLKGVLIGNGWIAPKEQYEAYLLFAYDKGIVQKGSDIAGRLEAQYRICQEALAEAETEQVDNLSCENVLQLILGLTQTKNPNPNGKNECVNMYDVRLKDTYPSCGMNWPPDLKYVTPYLRKREVIDALHINADKSTGWTECNGAVTNSFNAKDSKPSIDYMPDLLKEIDVLLFSGDQDMICNHIGTESLISNMEWNGGKGFEVSPGNWAPRRDWTVEGEAAGFWQEARNLTYVLFYNSSHMVPFDYPRRTRDMLDRFIGVNITTIGGLPSEGLLDGQKLPDTTVGGVSNSTSEDTAAKEKELNDAKWAAYQKSGEVVLAIVAISAAIWGFYIWRARRRTAGYTGLGPLLSERSRGATGLEDFRNRRTRRDVEAGDFDESELDDLRGGPSPIDMDDRDKYSVGEASDDDDAPRSEKQRSTSGPGPSSRS